MIIIMIIIIIMIESSAIINLRGVSTKLYFKLCAMLISTSNISGTYALITIT